MKNKAVNGLVAIALSLIFIEAVPYVSIALTIYGLWLASQVLKKTENSTKINRIIAIIASVIGYPLIIVLFIIFFKQLF